ncbi:MAG: hypothetical protein Fur0018_05390 [Anaerolineales bacterium]
MFKKAWGIWGGLVFLLAACQAGGTTAQPTGTPVATVLPEETSTPTSVPVKATQTNVSDAPPAGCTVVTRSLIPTGESPFPAVTADDWQLGPQDAPVTIIEYSDFQCPYCAQTAPLLRQIQHDFPEDVRLVYRNFPLVEIHEKARLGMQAAEAAGAQKAFWEMHDMLFGQQTTWNEMSTEAFQNWLVEQATALGLDVARFQADMLSEASAARSQKAWDDGKALGLTGTPTLVINGQYYSGPRDYWSLSAIIKLVKLEQQQFLQCPEMSIVIGKQYIATIQTPKGDIVIELLADKAPMAVNNFIFLAQQGWYDGVTFHRVIPGFVAQAGDPTGTGLGGPGYAFMNEISSDLRFDAPGMVGMANAGPDTNGSQFFITYTPQPQLNGGYTIFGKVIAGMDVLASLTPRDPAQNPNLPPGDAILSITIEVR